MSIRAMTHHEPRLSDDELRVHQIAMAKNVAILKDGKAKRTQVRLLCATLKHSIRSARSVQGGAW